MILCSDSVEDVTASDEGENRYLGSAIDFGHQSDLEQVTEASLDLSVK